MKTTYTDTAIAIFTVAGKEYVPVPAAGPTDYTRCKSVEVLSTNNRVRWDAFNNQFTIFRCNDGPVLFMIIIEPRGLYVPAGIAFGPRRKPYPGFTRMKQSAIRGNCRRTRLSSMGAFSNLSTNATSARSMGALNST
jgi:hypothetical protein